MSGNAEIEVAVQVRAVTAKALLVFDGKREVWLPKSQIADYAGSDDLDARVTSVFISEWLATEKGLV